MIGLVLHFLMNTKAILENIPPEIESEEKNCEKTEY